jgi:hypothetical protein
VGRGTAVDMLPASLSGRGLCVASAQPSRSRRYPVERTRAKFRTKLSVEVCRRRTMILLATRPRMSKGLMMEEFACPELYAPLVVLRTRVSAKLLGVISFREQVPCARSMPAMVNRF